MMPVEELVLQKLRTLPPEQQQEVLHFVEFLAYRQDPKTARQSVEGLWTDLGLTITDEDIDAVRREMWGRFPRELSE
jgi:hypothetical protein